MKVNMTLSWRVNKVLTKYWPRWDIQRTIQTSQYHLNVERWDHTVWWPWVAWMPVVCAAPVEVTLSCFSRGASEPGASVSAVVVSKYPYEWHQCMNRWRQVTYLMVPTPILSLSKGGCKTWRSQLVLQQSAWDYWLWRWQKRLRSFLFINDKQAVRTYVTTSRTMYGIVMYLRLRSRGSNYHIADFTDQWRGWTTYKDQRCRNSGNLEINMSLI